MSAFMSASRTSRLNPMSQPFVLGMKGSQHQEKASAIVPAINSFGDQGPYSLTAKDYLNSTTAAMETTPIITTIRKLRPTASHMTDSFVPDAICNEQQCTSSESSSGWTNESGNGMYFSLARLEGKSKNKHIFVKDQNPLNPPLQNSGDTILGSVKTPPAENLTQATNLYNTGSPSNSSALIKQQLIFENYNLIMKKWAIEHAANAPQRGIHTSTTSAGKEIPGHTPLPHKQNSVVSSIDSMTSYNWAKPQRRCSSPKLLANSLEEYYAMRDDISSFSGCVDLLVPGPTSSASERERTKQRSREIEHQGSRHKRACVIPAMQNAQKVAYNQNYVNRSYGGSYNNQILQASRTSQQARQKPCFDQPAAATVDSSEPERDFNGDLMRKGRGFDGTIKHWNVPCINQDHVGFADIDAIAPDYTTNCDKDSQGPEKKPMGSAPLETNRDVKYTTYAQLQARHQADTARVLEKKKAADEAGRHTVPAGSDVSNLARHSTLAERIGYYLSTLDAVTPDIPIEDDLAAEDYPFCYPLDKTTFPEVSMPIFSTATSETDTEEEKPTHTDTQERPEWMPTDVHKSASKLLKTQSKEWAKQKDCGWKIKAPKALKYPIGKYRHGGECQWDEVPYHGSLQEIERQIMAEEIF